VRYIGFALFSFLAKGELKRLFVDISQVYLTSLALK